MKLSHGPWNGIGNHLPPLLLLLALLTSCSHGGQTTDEARQGNLLHEECNSAYYWRTVFQLDSTERQFLKTHNVGRLYIRMFDVVDNPMIENDKMWADKVVPNATIVFKDSVPVAHVVPTVYITLEALRSMMLNENFGYWARLILVRVMNMCSYNEIRGVEEIQLDCDWTEGTRLAFFKLCEAMIEGMAMREDTKDMALSSTIRLHQLKQEMPPVDRGVLMVYNTGSFLNPKTSNSILSYDDVKPYLKALNKASLHLDIAYPIYRWGLVYRNGSFKGLLHDTDLSRLQTEKLKDGRYKVVREGYINGKKMMAGDIIRIENSDYETVSKVKGAIEEIIGKEHSTILYHLSSENIRNYEEVEINELYK